MSDLERMTVAEVIRAATERLSANSDTARLDAELLMAHVLGVGRSDMLLGAMRAPAPASFAALVERRLRHEPVAYIIGSAEFYGLELAVSNATLIPRGDSEVLIDAALAFAGEAGRALDLGTGSGALLLALLANCEGWHGVGVDASPQALAIAAANSVSLGLDRRCDWRERNWHSAGWADDLGTYDLILCNPPYVEDDAKLDPDVRDYEPASALFSGQEGLDDYRVLIPQTRKLLSAGGVAVFEIGATQADAVTEIARSHGFSAEIRLDLANRPRAVVLR